MEFSESETKALKSCAIALADAARPETLKYFRSTGLTAENKLTDSFDPVTVADRAAEKAMRDVLAKLRPDDGIFGEEYGHQDGTSGLTWVLDPIDGTRSYISGTPTWGVLIAVSDENGPVLGIVDQPYIGERFFGGFGEAWVEGPLGRSDLKTSTVTNLTDATLFTTFPEVGTPAERHGFEAVRDQVKLTRYGTDCYAYALVAAGQVELVVEAGLNAYDIQGPIGVVEAAGGVFTDWKGGPVHEGGQVLAAANREIHAQALERLKPFAN